MITYLIGPYHIFLEKFDFFHQNWEAHMVVLTTFFLEKFDFFHQNWEAHMGWAWD